MLSQLSHRRVYTRRGLCSKLNAFVTRSVVSGWLGCVLLSPGKENCRNQTKHKGSNRNGLLCTQCLCLRWLTASCSRSAGVTVCAAQCLKSRSASRGLKGLSLAYAIASTDKRRRANYW